MNTFFNIFGATLVFLGMMAMGGSANDCGGKCMEQANDLTTMLLVAGLGMTSCIVGMIFVYLANTQEAQ